MGNQPDQTRSATAFARTEELCLRHAEPHTLDQQVSVTAMSASARLERRLLAALGKVAQLVIEDQDFLPVFERLEHELAALQSQADAIERARRYLPKSN